jgi:hypothetical protein
MTQVTPMRLSAVRAISPDHLALDERFSARPAGVAHSEASLEVTHRRAPWRHRFGGHEPARERQHQRDSDEGERRQALTSLRNAACEARIGAGLRGIA